MSNSFTSPPLLPQALSVIAGEKVINTSIKETLDLCNFTSSFLGTSNLVSQCFDDIGGLSIYRYNSSSTPPSSNLEYRVPTISNQHKTLEIYIVGLCLSGSGVLDINVSENSINTSGSITINNTSYTQYSTQITLSSISTNYIDLSFKLTSNSTNVTCIKTIMCRWVELSSPLNAVLQTRDNKNIVPFGLDRVNPNYPLTSRIGHDLRDNILSLRSRPRSIISWSGLFNTSPSSSLNISPARSIGIGDIKTLRGYSPFFKGASLQDFKFKVAIKAGSTPSNPVKLSILGNTIEINQGGWSMFDLTPKIEPDQVYSDLFSIELFEFGFDEDQDNFDNLGNSGNSGDFITAFSIWSI